MRPKTRAVTIRSVLAGLLTAAWVNFWVSYSEYLIHSSRLNISQFPMALFATFVFLLIARGCAPRWMRLDFSNAELMVILSVGSVAAVVPTCGIAGFLLGVIGSPYYFASPENHWAEYIHPYLASWIVPRDVQALTWFFEGTPAGARAHWQAWLVPLFWWGMLVAAFALLCACVTALRRKQWIEHEKLTFPLVAPTLDMIEGVPSLPPFYRRRLFWAGFALAFGVMAWNVATFFAPMMPSIPVQGRYRWLLKGFPFVDTRLNFFTLGFAHFANVEVLFSVLFFYLINYFEIGTLNRVGFTMSGHDNFCSMDPISSWQSFGALVFLVAWGLWMARGHLRNTFRRALGENVLADAEKNEMLRYRTAWIGLGLSVLFVLAWFWRVGMDWRVLTLYFLANITICIGIARIISQTGLLYVREPLSPQLAAIYSIGSRSISPQSMTAIAMSFSVLALGRGLFMPALSQVTKLTDSVRANKRLILVIVMAGLVVSLVVSLGLTLVWGYEYGAYHFQSWPFAGGSRSVFYHTIAKIRDAFPMDWAKLGFLALGACVMALCTFLRYRVAWWPVHPVGLTICGTDVVMHSALAILIAWVCKLIVLRAGGPALYKRSRAFFLGLLVGYAAGVTLSFFVDVFWFYGEGHCVHAY